MLLSCMILQAYTNNQAGRLGSIRYISNDLVKTLEATVLSKHRHVTPVLDMARYPANTPPAGPESCRSQTTSGTSDDIMKHLLLTRMAELYSVSQILI